MRNSSLLAAAPTACQDGNNTIRTSSGHKSIYQILAENSVDVDKIEASNIQQWIPLTPFTVPTLQGDQVCDKIWFNGQQQVYDITFEDGTTYAYTGNHKLLVRHEGGETEWVQVSDLRETDDIVECLSAVGAVAV